MTKTDLEFGISVIVICLIFEICDLEFSHFSTPRLLRNDNFANTLDTLSGQTC